MEWIAELYALHSPRLNIQIVHKEPLSSTCVYAIVGDGKVSTQITRMYTITSLNLCLGLCARTMFWDGNLNQQSEILGMKARLSHMVTKARGTYKQYTQPKEGTTEVSISIL